MSNIILGLGAGQCGMKLLADILNAQPGVGMTCEETPLMSWEQTQGDLIGCESPQITMAERFDRWRLKRREFFICKFRWKTGGNSGVKTEGLC